MQLKIDTEFQALIPPLSDEEFRQLEGNIKTEGCRDALVVWDGVIVDGHNRYRICRENDIPFKTEEKEFADRDGAVEWIILNQFGRRNLSPAQRSELALKLKPVIREKAKENQKTSTGGDVPQLLQNSVKAEKINTQKQLAKIAGVSHDTLGRVEVIHKKGTPEQIDRIRKGGKGNSVNAVYKEVVKKKEDKKEPVKMLPKETDDVPVKAAPAIPEGYKVCRRCRQKMPLTAFENSVLNGYSDDVCGLCIHLDMEACGKKMKRHPMSKETREAIKKTISTIYNTDAAPDRTAESIAEEIRANIDSCLGALAHILEGVSVSAREDKTKIIAALSEAETAIEKLKGKYLYE